MIPVVKKATPAAVAVLRQATALRPKRKKASDGLLPSPAHQRMNPNSDHNSGLAVDLTHDPDGGIDCHEIFDKLKSDKRVKYLIFTGVIWTPKVGDARYTGINKHNKHLHISINQKYCDDVSPWFPWMGTPTVLGKVKANVKKLPKKN